MYIIYRIGYLVYINPNLVQQKLIPTLLFFSIEWISEDPLTIRFPASCQSPPERASVEVSGYPADPVFQVASNHVP